MVVKKKISKKKVKKISLRKSRRKTSKKSKKKSRKVSKKKKVNNKKYFKKMRISQKKSKRRNGLRVYTKKNRQTNKQKGGASPAPLTAAQIVSTWFPTVDISIDPLAVFSKDLLELYYGDILPSVKDPKQFGNPMGGAGIGAPNFVSWPLVLQLLALQTYIRYFDPVHFNNDTFNKRWLFIVLFDYLLDHIHDFAKGPRNTTFPNSDILVDKLKKKRPETDQVFVFGLPYIDNFLARQTLSPDSSSITWNMLYTVLPSIQEFHEKCFKTIMIPNENDVLNFIINQVCEGDMSVEQIDSKNIMSDVIKTGLQTILRRSKQDMTSFTKLLIDTINNQYFSKLQPFKDYIIKDESINIGGLLGLFTRALKIPIKDGGVLQEVFPNVIDPGSGSLRNVLEQISIPEHGLESVRTSIKGVDQYITLRSYKPITLYYIKIEIKPPTTPPTTPPLMPVIQVSYKNRTPLGALLGTLTRLGTLDDSGLSVDNVFDAYDHYIDIVAAVSPPRVANPGSSLEVLYNLVSRLYDEDVDENVVIAILLDLKKGGDWLQVDFATMNNKGFKTEDRECMAYAILVSCAVVFRYNYSSNGLLGAIKNLFTKKIKANTQLLIKINKFIQLGGKGTNASRRKELVEKRGERINWVKLRKAERTARLQSVRSRLGSGSSQRNNKFSRVRRALALEIMEKQRSEDNHFINEFTFNIDNFSTGEIEYYEDYSSLMEELYDKDKEIGYIADQLYDSAIAGDAPEIEFEEMILRLIPGLRAEIESESEEEEDEEMEEEDSDGDDAEEMETDPAAYGENASSKKLEQFGGLRLENITSKMNNLPDILQKILQGKPSSFDTGLQIMCPHSRMKLQITEELINNLGKIPQKILLLQNKIPSLRFDAIYQYMFYLIQVISTKMTPIASTLQGPNDTLEEEYRRIIKIYETLKKIVSNIASKSFVSNFNIKPIDIDFTKTLDEIIDQFKTILKDFKPTLEIVLKNKKIIGKIMEGCLHLKNILNLPSKSDTVQVTAASGAQFLVHFRGNAFAEILGIENTMATLQIKNSTNMSKLSTIQDGFKTWRGRKYIDVDHMTRLLLNSVRTNIATLTDPLKTPEPTRSEQKIIAVYTTARDQLSGDTDAAIKLVLQKIPTFKKYNLNRTRTLRPKFTQLDILKKYINKIEKIAKFIGVPEPFR